MTEAEKKLQATLDWLAAEPLLKNLDEEDPEPMVWYHKKLDGCINAGGSENWMYLKKGTSSNLIIFFIGGGFAFSADTARGGGISDFFVPPAQAHYFTEECHPNNEYYFFEVLGNQGLFSLRTENRFADWSIAMINYGTGDIHIGNGDHCYIDKEGSMITVHHHGYRNYIKAMELIHTLFPKPDRLLITGGSAGGFGVCALAADIAESYPECKDITICPDSACLKKQDWPEIVRNVWRAPEHIASAAISDNIVLDMLKMVQRRLGDRARYLFLIGYPDGVLAAYQNYVDTGCFETTQEGMSRFADILKKQILQLKTMEHPFHIYLHAFHQNGMIQHCTLDAPTFRSGQPSPMDWLYDAVNNRLADVGMDLISEERNCRS